MRRFLESRFTFFALAAVVVSTIVLLIIQYRSLSELEKQTRIAAQENLRQSLQKAATDVQNRLRWIGEESLANLDEQMLADDRASDLQAHLAAIHRQHPVVRRVFVAWSCLPPDNRAVVTSTSTGVSRLDLSRQSDARAFQRVMRAYDVALAIKRTSGDDQRLLFGHAACADPQCEDGFHAYFFRPLTAHAVESASFAVVEFDTSYLRQRYLTQFLNASGNSRFDFALLSGSDRIDAATAGGSGYPMHASLAPALPPWDLAIAYRGTTVEELARNSFRKNLLLAIFVVLCLLAAITLTLRATQREMRVADAKSTFVANVSHELKTPLALIRMSAETLEMDRVKSAAKAREYYRTIRNESLRLTRMVDSILDFARIEAGHKRYQRVEVDITDIVRGIVSAYDDQLVTLGFRLNLFIDRDLPPVIGDGDALAQAILNLLNNAIKYSGQSREVGISIRKRSNTVAIAVQDFGIGIARSEHRRIFENFYRVGTGLVHDTRGSGLGLTLVEHIVEAHNGKIVVESSPGKGSRFTIIIPAAALRIDEAVHGDVASESIAKNSDRRG